MTKIKAVHWKAPSYREGKTRCGEQLRRVEWRDDVKDATCNRCIAYAKQDWAI